MPFGYDMAGFTQYQLWITAMLCTGSTPTQIRIRFVNTGEDHMTMIWANKDQLINPEAIVSIAVSKDGNSGIAQVLGSDEPIGLEGRTAQRFLETFASDRPK